MPLIGQTQSLGRSAVVPPAVRPVWSKTKFNLAIFHKDTGEFLHWEEVSGVGYGSLVVHPTYQPVGVKDQWALSHAPSGRRVACCATEEDCKRIGEWFQARCCLLLRKTDAAEIKQRCLPDVVEYLEICHREGRYLVPPTK